MLAVTNIALVVAIVRLAKPLIQKKPFWSQLEVVSCYFKNFSSDQPFAVLDSAIWRYFQPSSMSTKQNADKMYAKYCKSADVYDKTTQDYIFIEGVDTCICQRVREYWTPEAAYQSYRHRLQSAVATSNPETEFEPLARRKSKRYCKTNKKKLEEKVAATRPPTLQTKDPPYRIVSQSTIDSVTCQCWF